LKRINATLGKKGRESPWRARLPGGQDVLDLRVGKSLLEKKMGHRRNSEGKGRESLTFFESKGGEKIALAPKREGRMAMGGSPRLLQSWKRRGIS